MTERAHLSIGEVLSLVQEDFPDVTISKIRFLESQGLLDPERTPSGYRKFYDDDIERLQWILTQQRDHFLPLKVIRERLDEWDATGTHPEGDRQTPRITDLPGAPTMESESESDPSDGHPDEDAAVDHRSALDPRRAAATLAAASAMEVLAPEPSLIAEVPAAPVPAASAPQPRPDRLVESEPEPLRVGPTSTSLTVEELASQAGVSVEVIRDLEDFSMIESRRIGPDVYFEPSARVVVDACRRFLDHGIEVRHLRMYKIAAEREAGMFEQLVMPLLKQRNPEARARAVETVTELVGVGEELHAALLRKALSNTLPQ